MRQYLKHDREEALAALGTPTAGSVRKDKLVEEHECEPADGTSHRGCGEIKRLWVDSKKVMQQHIASLWVGIGAWIGAAQLSLMKHREVLRFGGVATEHFVEWGGILR